LVHFFILRSGRAICESGKFPQKSKFFNFFPFGQKISSDRVKGYLGESQPNMVSQDEVQIIVSISGGYEGLQGQFL